MLRIDDYQRVRLRCDLGGKTSLDGAITEALTGSQPVFGRGAKTRFEFGLFYGSDIADASQISSARLRILASSSPNSAVAIDGTIGLTSMNLGISAEDWATKEASKAHLRFEFTASECAESAFGGGLADDADHWWILTHGNGDSFLASGLIKSRDVGYNPSGGTPVSTPNAATIEQFEALMNARMADFIKKVNGPGVTVTFTSQTTGKQVKFGAQDDGDPLIATQVET